MEKEERKRQEEKVVPKENEERRVSVEILPKRAIPTMLSLTLNLAGYMLNNQETRSRKKMTTMKKVAVPKMKKLRKTMTMIRMIQMAVKAPAAKEGEGEKKPAEPVTTPSADDAPKKDDAPKSGDGK